MKTGGVGGVPIPGAKTHRQWLATVSIGQSDHQPDRFFSGAGMGLGAAIGANRTQRPRAPARAHGNQGALPRPGKLCALVHIAEQTRDPYGERITISAWARHPQAFCSHDEPPLGNQRATSTANTLRDHSGGGGRRALASPVERGRQGTVVHATCHAGGERSTRGEPTPPSYHGRETQVAGAKSHPASACLVHTEIVVVCVLA
jgi:hypothetical protein